MCPRTSTYFSSIQIFNGFESVKSLKTGRMVEIFEQVEERIVEVSQEGLSPKDPK